MIECDPREEAWESPSASTVVPMAPYIERPKPKVEVSKQFRRSLGEAAAAIAGVWHDTVDPHHILRVFHRKK